MEADACGRMIEGVVGNTGSVEEDSFYHGLLDYPHYTRPAEFRGMPIPDALLGGNHEVIRQWRRRMALEKTLTSRDEINSQLRGVLDEATGKWGIRVNRVELKAIEPPASIKESMEKQMRANREKRAVILTAEGQRQARILTAEGDRQAAILRAEGQAKAIDTVFEAIHRNDPDPKLLAYQYLQMLPELAKGPGNTFWVIPSEVTSALQNVTKAFNGTNPEISRE